MSYLLDVNVLIALAWPRHVHHRPASDWFATVHATGWATTPVTEAGFIRVSSNPHVFPDGATPSQAAGLLAQFHDIPGHVFWPDSTRLTACVTALSEHVHGFASVTDAHLAFLALANSGTLATFDSRAARLAADLGAQSLLLGT